MAEKLTLAPPRFSTQPDSSRANQLDAYRKMARALGFKQLQPWQEYVIALATETLDNGQPAYTEIRLSLPRQNGKTVLLALAMLVRMLRWPGGGRQIVMLGAQDQVAARRLLVDSIWPYVESSGLAELAGFKLRQGGIVDLRSGNGNHLYLMSSNRASGHGTTLNCALIDEVWALPDDEVLQAVGPAMLTIADAQLWLVSTMGTETSTLWQAKVDHGRALLETKKPSRTAYIEWSADAEADIDDPKVWAAANPAFGTLISKDKIQALRETQSEAAFRRAVLNQPSHSAFERVIPDLAWQAVQKDNEIAVPYGGIVLGIDATPERKSGCVVAVDKHGRVEVVAHQPGADWCAQLAHDICKTQDDVVGVALIGNGPLATATEWLQRRDIQTFALSRQQSAAASAAFYDSVLTERLVVRKDYSLDAAVAAATRRQVGEGWAWGRYSADLDVCPLIAASLAYWIATSEADKPEVQPPSIVDLTAIATQGGAEFEAQADAWRRVSV